MKKVCKTSQEYNRILDLITQNYSLLTDVYHYLQGVSDRYPWVSFYTARKFFFNSALVQGFGVKNTIFDLSIKSADFNKGKAVVVHDNVLNRFQFIEWIILLAKYIYSERDSESQ